jgi:hypothetical protein
MQGNTTRTATAIIAEIRNGEAVIELSEHIKRAIAAVREHGRKAVVSLDLTIMPAADGMEKLVEAPILIRGDVSSKLPEDKGDPSLFFVDKDGNAVREIKRQGSLLEEVKKSAG